ncbi:acyl-CoA N-acyltransferase [Mycena polygramma]|nr:acyl-CoA N-acyltransferase [Mycena polygramma]
MVASRFFPQRFILRTTTMIFNETLTSLSGRVLLVPPTPSDDASMAALRSHPETRRYIPFFPENCTPEDARERRLSREPNAAIVDFSIYAVTPGSSPKFVGSTGIFDIDEAFKSCEAGVSISPDSFRGGYATDALHRVLAYAFEERKLHRVEFQTTSDNNVGMRGWLDMAGATLEATQRESWPDGRGGYIDICVYGILEKEWRDTVKIRLEERIDRVNLAKV